MANNYWNTIPVQELRAGDLMQFENGKLVYEIFNVARRRKRGRFTEYHVKYGHKPTFRSYEQTFVEGSIVIIRNQDFRYD